MSRLIGRNTFTNPEVTLRDSAPGERTGLETVRAQYISSYSERHSLAAARYMAAKCPLGSSFVRAFKDRPSPVTKQPRRHAIFVSRVPMRRSARRRAHLDDGSETSLRPLFVRGCRHVPLHRARVCFVQSLALLSLSHHLSFKEPKRHWPLTRPRERASAPAYVRQSL